MLFIPTYLYIKQHTKTGKLYFGKTIKSNPIKYNGSGKYWSNHIKTHGKEHVITLWCEKFYDLFELVSFAISFSNKLDIVNSKSWANQIIEDGIGSTYRVNNSNKEPWNKNKKCPSLSKPKQSQTKDHRDKISISLKLYYQIHKDKSLSKNYPSNRKKRLNINHKILTCPWCGKTGGSNILKRWHFDNCKFKN